MLVKCPHCGRNTEALHSSKVETCFFCGQEFQAKVAVPPPIVEPLEPIVEPMPLPLPDDDAPPRRRRERNEDDDRPRRRRRDDDRDEELPARPRRRKHPYRDLAIGLGIIAVVVGGYIAYTLATEKDVFEVYAEAEKHPRRSDDLRDDTTQYEKFLYRYEGKPFKGTGTVNSYDQAHPTYAYVTLKSDSGQSAYLYLRTSEDSYKSDSPLKPGDRISFRGTMRELKFVDGRKYIGVEITWFKIK